MKFKCGDKIVNKITGATYVLSSIKKIKENDSEGYLLTLRKKSGYETVLVDKNMVDILFKLNWTSWEWEKIDIFGEKIPVKWKHNGDLMVMESQKYGKVSSKVHPDDTFDVKKGYDLCILRMAKRVINSKIVKYYE
ncbi:hypothetical protein [uncultured Clostridium sp.]|uniref:hypothetical protein n=1 Tax=uncultured Clostridium sp. TaxID=59620 RepID=UPI002592CFF8|nr:hypothetical protein [uncultured Clostridium sp.]